ncbi:MAG: DUF2520 domain-containing protein [Acidimicrobiia bacterium]|nr:DUF2520 domain-containing protein [Acidimicrobiia bacterium]
MSDDAQEIPGGDAARRLRSGAVGSGAWDSGSPPSGSPPSGEPGSGFDQKLQSIALIGPGRAGMALANGLTQSGLRIVNVAGRAPGDAAVIAAAAELGARPVSVEQAGADVGLVVLAVPDAIIGDVALRLATSLTTGALAIHCSGATGLDVFDRLLERRPDVRVGSIHPLQTLPGRRDDAERLVGAGFAVEGPIVELTALVDRLGGIAFEVGDRALYHAGAVLASNHVVALMGQLARLAAEVGAPIEVFRPLAFEALTNAFDLGPEAALTGPVARGDVETVARHLDALPADERSSYRALAREALKLVERPSPELVALLDGDGGVGERWGVSTPE